AVEDPTISPQVNEVLAAGSKRLRGAGYHSRSAFLTSPTFGAASWLAHATLQSGVWVDGQQRYNQLLTNDRLTLTRAFERPGWRTTFALPANTQDWPVGSSFCGSDTRADARDLDYHGREFGWSTMPDQYTLQAFRRLALDQPGGVPIMAEIDLTSSHHPWTPLPRLVPWDRVGDGSIFDCTSECQGTSEGLQSSE